jgi:hypothetical protein
LNLDVISEEIVLKEIRQKKTIKKKRIKNLKKKRMQKLKTKEKKMLNVFQKLMDIK